MIKVSVATAEVIDINISSSDAVSVKAHENEAVKINMGAVCRVSETDYEKLDNLPQINNVTVISSKTSKDYGLLGADNIAKSSDLAFMFKQRR